MRRALSSRQNTQIGGTERTNVLLARIVALLEAQHEQAGLPPLPGANAPTPRNASRYGILWTLKSDGEMHTCYKCKQSNRAKSFAKGGAPVGQRWNEWQACRLNRRWAKYPNGVPPSREEGYVSPTPAQEAAAKKATVN